jgi:Uncharacterized protein conserved in bacteria
MNKAKRIIAAVSMIAVAFAMTAAPAAFNAPDVHAAVTAKATSSTYWIKVNKNRNVATVYKKTDGKWKAFRAMLVSTGGSKTPSGTFSIGKKQRWGLLMEDVKGQYCTNITTSVLFHSVWYYQYTKTSQPTAEFNKLGTVASHGCVRLACIDAKWIYDNCPAGTKVTIYSSKTAGPLGKPKAIKSYSSTGLNWDPTDPSAGNPNFKLRKPVIRISSSKKTSVKYGASYNLKAGVKAKNTNALQNITDELIVSSVQIRKNGAWETASFSTTKPGKYKITYSVTDKYCRGTTKATFKVTVKKADTPVISAEDRTAEVGSANAVTGMTVKLGSKDITANASVYIMEPGKTEYSSAYTYAQASEYKFMTAGEYKIKIVAHDPSDASKISRKEITVTVTEAAGTGTGA